MSSPIASPGDELGEPVPRARHQVAQPAAGRGRSGIGAGRLRDHRGETRRRAEQRVDGTFNATFYLGVSCTAECDPAGWELVNANSMSSELVTEEAGQWWWRVKGLVRMPCGRSSHHIRDSPPGTRSG